MNCELESLVDLGVAPAEAIGAIIVGRIAQQALEHGARLLADRGATAAEVDEYRDSQSAALTVWMRANLAQATEAADEIWKNAVAKAEVERCLG